MPVSERSTQFDDVTSGVVYIHSSPAAVCPHVEWTLTSTLRPSALRTSTLHNPGRSGGSPRLDWTPQPAMPGQLCAAANWVGPVGTGARLAHALRSWSVLRFEVTEDPSAGVDGRRFSHTPQLGLWTGATSANGDVVVGEMQLRAMLDGCAQNPKTPEALAAQLDSVLGTPWDEALEEYRSGGSGVNVPWLSQDVG